MRISFIPPSEYEFKVLFSSSPLHKGSGLDDISIFQPKRLHRSVGNRRGAGIFLVFIAKRVLPFIFINKHSGINLYTKHVCSINKHINKIYNY